MKFFSRKDAKAQRKAGSVPEVFLCGFAALREKPSFTILCFFVALQPLLFSTGCIVVGGYNSERGWFIWPGTFVLLLIGLALFLLLRRRR